MNVQAKAFPFMSYFSDCQTSLVTAKRNCNTPLFSSLLVLAGFVVSAQTSLAQVAQAPQSATPSSSARVGGKTAAIGLPWSQLTPAQQQALAPLAPTWDTGMSESQKRKWLEISKNYNGLTPQAQATLNSRMREWAALSPQERAQARLNFGKINETARELTPEEKKAKWEAYQALTAEEKQRLAATASPKPAGAATATKPVAPQKLVTVPLRAASKPGSMPTLKIGPSLPASSAGAAPPN